MRKSLIIAALCVAPALLTAGQAQAEVTTIRYPGAYANNPVYVTPSLVSTLQFSKPFMAIMTDAASSLSVTGPSTMLETVDPRRPWDRSWSINSPVMTMNLRGGEPSDIIDAGTTGGFTLSLAQDPGGFISTGGSLTLSHLSINLAQRLIYADMAADHGIGELKHQAIWTFANVTGTTSLDEQPGALGAMGMNDCPGGCNLGELPNFKFTLSGLSLTNGVMDVYARSLGLTANGIVALGSITNQGSLTISGVPESSTLLMMTMGLLGLGWQGKRQRAQARAHITG